MEEKSIAVVVKARNAEGIDVAESCKGVYFSTILGEMFAYLPGTPRDQFSAPVMLEFLDKPAEVCFTLLTWPGREPVPDGTFGGSAFFMESTYAESEGSLKRNRILKSGGRKFK
ncbi:hypothetical protein GCM10009825_22080 [Arthrobacter humicola]|uniref:Uncharacterized protein n=1 Tax=Arthrobacter humicola TaxID=409291 RepID=A0ABN2Z4F2_9MICC